MQDPDLSERIRDGSYFEEGRKWYSEVYMSLISERFLYLVLTSVAVLTSLLALIGVIRLLPIVPAEPFLIRTPDVVHTLPLITPLAKHRAELTDDSLRRWFVEQYVVYRESYSRDKIAPRARSIFHWSTRDSYEVYRRSIDTSNPRSPVVRYESSAEREVEVMSTEILPDPNARENAYVAKVNFVAYVIRLGQVETSYWTAELAFNYKDAFVDQENLQPKTGRMKVTPMEFKVGSYVVMERKQELQQ